MMYLDYLSSWCDQPPLSLPQDIETVEPRRKVGRREGDSCRIKLRRSRSGYEDTILRL